MTMTAKQPSFDRPAIVRHAVYGSLWPMLPMASLSQKIKFAANLALCRNRAIAAVMDRIIDLRVTPDQAAGGLEKAEIEQTLAIIYGDQLFGVPGFYKSDEGRWRLNLPERCALYAYRSRIGFYNGIVCQPIDRIDFFFLLSSREQGGHSAVKLEPRDREFLERFKEPATPPIPPPAAQADLTGWKWTGRRFIEPK